MFISASTIGRDLMGRMSMAQSVEVREAIVHRWTKIGLIISALFSIILALVVPSVVKIWYAIGTAIVPGLLVPLMASYFEGLRIPPRYGFLAMLLGWGVSTLWLVSGQLQFVDGAPSYWLGIEPMYPGLVISMLMWIVGRHSIRLRRRKIG
jgi:hypothetical protein